MDSHFLLGLGLIIFVFFLCYLFRNENKERE
jgi:hypothetical protein